MAVSVSKIVRQATLYLSALLLAVGYPLAAMAEEPEVTTPEPAPTTVVEKPAEPEKTYTYNPETKKWDSNVWYFNPTTGRYEAVPQPVAPTVIDPTTQPIENPGPGSDSTVGTNAKVDDTLNVNTDVNVNNNVESTAKSGDASVIKNLLAGDATTGDAATTATIVNSVNSVIAAGDNKKAAEFTYDVMGDVKGDIMLYPMMLKAMLEANAEETTNVEASKTVNVNQTNTLTNDMNLSAMSGNATVSKNTQGGNATTGSANAIANVMNVLNSMIAAQQSFVGTINIYGSLEGDILIAPDFIPQMIANNKAKQVATVSETDIKSQNQDTIINNIALAAQSGTAAVTGNTQGGNATSGSADTNVVIFNLSGHDIVASNSLLVFVNVLGKWVGVILDAPAGTTAAMIGENVTKNDVKSDLTVDVDSANTITNNITMVAKSGDATVSDNTTAGNATTGDATAQANVANISNTSIGVSNWFGVLWINVLGDWLGSFGVNTAYGNTPEPNASGTGTRQTPKNSGPEPGQVFAFVARKTPASGSGVPQATVIDTRHIEPDGSGVKATLASASVAKPVVTPQVGDMMKGSVDFRLLIAAGSVALIGISALGIRRLLKGGSDGNIADL